MKRIWEWIKHHKNRLDIFCGFILIVLTFINIYKTNPNMYGIASILIMLCGINSIATFTYRRGSNQPLFHFYKLSYRKYKQKM